MSIDSNVILIKGSWNYANGKVVVDNNVLRIEKLIQSQLKKLGTDASGWDTLYIDLDDGRYWELLYLESDLSGGGPPTLQVISREDVEKKYSGIFPSK